MTHAFYFMTNNEGIHLSSKQYEKLCDDWSIRNSEINKGRITPQKVRDKISKSLRGRIFSEETRRKISEKIKGKNHNDTTKKKISEKNSGKIRSEEMKQRQSEKMSGNRNPFYGKHHDEKTRVQCGVNKNKKYVHKDGKNFLIQKELLDEYINLGYILGCIEKNKNRMIWICNNYETKMIIIDELEKYVELGYIRGRKYH